MQPSIHRRGQDLDFYCTEKIVAQTVLLSILKMRRSVGTLSEADSGIDIHLTVSENRIVIFETTA